jgi:hypothetical protein
MCKNFLLYIMIPAATWLNDMEPEFIVQVLKVLEVFFSNKFNSDWMKIIIVYTQSLKQLCEQYEDHSLYHVNICYGKNICTSIRHY